MSGWYGRAGRAVRRLRGGGDRKGPDVEKKEKKKTALKNKYLYYTAGPGLMYGGICKNKHCKAYEQKITYKRGFGDKIYPLIEEVEEEFGCPGCKKPFKLEEFALYRCDAIIKYKKKGENIKTMHLSPRGDEYIDLGKEKGVGVEATYNLLRFDVKEIDAGCVIC